jgi:periplasmic divalent cation tolerance protein
MITLFYTTHPSQAAAQYCANYLLESRLVACAQVFAAESAYWWQGDLAREGEFVALFKTRPDLIALVEAAVTALHSYQVPCIIHWAVQANAAYEKWVIEQTTA